MQKDRKMSHFLLANRASIDRKVKKLDDGIETLTESDDPAKVEAVAEEWGVTHFAWGRLDQEDFLVDYPFFQSHPLFVERYRLRRWVRIFELQSD